MTILLVMLVTLKSKIKGLQVSGDKRIVVTGEVRAEGRSFLTKD